jgi:hypothetical protein
MSEKLLRKYMGELARKILRMKPIDEDLFGHYGTTIEYLSLESDLYDYFDYLHILKILCVHNIIIPTKIHQLILITGNPGIISPYKYGPATKILLDKYLEEYNWCLRRKNIVNK